MIHFEWPWLVLLLPLPWLVYRLLPAAAEQHDGALFLPFATALQQAHKRSAATDKVRVLGMTLCWLLLLLAATRPQWLGEAVALPESGRNLMLAVDVSGSMEQADLGVRNRTRLDVVKSVAGDFIQRRNGDRIALILFGTQAYLQTPFTLDRTTVNTLLQEAVIGIAGRETAIGDAIGMALKNIQGQEGEHLLILLTDGANSAGAVDPAKAAELAAQRGLRIHTIGIGGKPQAVRGLLGIQMVNPARGLDEQMLKQIATQSGGRYFRAQDRDSLEEIYQQIDQLEPVEDGEQMVRPSEELYPWPLGAALILSLLLAILPPHRWRAHD
ncbi:MAG: VWA domain-containing protein [Gammaproteobacteria bacterium]|nr:VWA domain-containing protein [Gammaproteobacteria bacterium]MBT5747209.1 VWA domain-containing protein [Gammaproteobacteria bacterium]